MNHNESLNELALFAGAGGGILGGLLCGFRTVCAVEWDEHARQCLTARQDDGCLEPFPVWDDVQTFDGKPWRGDGVLWERITLDIRTSENESGYWPTPLKSDGYLSSYPHKSFARDHSIASLPEFVSRSFGMRISPETSERLMGWPDGWTGWKESATDKFQTWCISRGISCNHKTL